MIGLNNYNWDGTTPRSRLKHYIAFLMVSTASLLVAAYIVWVLFYYMCPCMR